MFQTTNQIKSMGVQLKLSNMGIKTTDESDKKQQKIGI